MCVHVCAYVCIHVCVSFVCDISYVLYKLCHEYTFLTVCYTAGFSRQQLVWELQCWMQYLGTSTSAESKESAV